MVVTGLKEGAVRESTLVSHTAWTSRTPATYSDRSPLADANAHFEQNGRAPLVARTMRGHQPAAESSAGSSRDGPSGPNSAAPLSSTPTSLSGPGNRTAGAPPLPCWLSGPQGRVHVQDRGRRPLPSRGPHHPAGLRPGLAQPVERLLADAVQHPDGRVRGHLAEEVRLVPQRRHVRHADPAPASITATWANSRPPVMNRSPLPGEPDRRRVKSASWPIRSPGWRSPPWRRPGAVPRRVRS